MTNDGVVEEICTSDMQYYTNWNLLLGDFCTLNEHRRCPERVAQHWCSTTYSLKLPTNALISCTHSVGLSLSISWPAPSMKTSFETLIPSWMSFTSLMLDQQMEVLSTRGGTFRWGQNQRGNHDIF